MLTRLLYLVGVILIIVGILKYVGIITLASAAAGVLIAVGVIVCLVVYFVVDGGAATYRGRGTRRF